MIYFIIALAIIIVVLLVVFYLIKRKRVIHKVRHMSEEEKLCEVNKALSPFGFTFYAKQDIVISKNDSWQRDIGYSDFFDLKAPYLNMVMDCEPIYFDYDHKCYRIEFWKGQYGITTGAEAGIYIRDKECKNTHEFRCANDSEILPMQFELYKKCFLFKRCGFTWWLTGFDVGRFSRPKDLALKIGIRFPNQKMQVAFVEGLLNAGYNANKISVCGSLICFTICKPKNYKLNHCHKLVKCFVQIINYINCSLYMWFTRCFRSTLDKLTFIRYMAPHFYHFVIKLSIPRRKQKKHCKKKGYKKGAVTK